MMPKYPFVVIPDHVDAVALHHKSKCLFWTIMATISPLTSEMQADFKHWFRRHVAEEIVVQQHKSLELLQAILIHLAWSVYPVSSSLLQSNHLFLSIIHAKKHLTSGKGGLLVLRGHAYHYHPATRKLSRRRPEAGQGTRRSMAWITVLTCRRMEGPRNAHPA